MTAAAQLRAQAAALERQALALREIADALDAAPVAPAPTQQIDTAAAMRLTRKSSSWLYATARKHPEIGWRIQSGSWVWSKDALQAFLAGRASASREKSEICDAQCEENERRPLPVETITAHSHDHENEEVE